MKKFICFCALIALAIPRHAYGAGDDLVVIVNKSNPIENVTKGQLRKLILGEQDSWPGGKKVSVILRAPGPERSGVLRSICEMSDDDFNQEQMHANFAGAAGGAPKVVSTGPAVRQLVTILPGAIGFVSAADVNESVKVVTVDGIAAGQPGYKIKEGK